MSTINHKGTNYSKNNKSTHGSFPLLFAHAGETLEIVGNAESKELESKLNNMGLKPGVKIKVIQEKSPHGVIIALGKSRLGIDCELAHCLTVVPTFKHPEKYPNFVQ